MLPLTAICLHLQLRCLSPPPPTQYLICDSVFTSCQYCGLWSVYFPMVSWIFTDDLHLTLSYLLPGIGRWGYSSISFCVATGHTRVQRGSGNKSNPHQPVDGCCGVTERLWQKCEAVLFPKTSYASVSSVADFFPLVILKACPTVLPVDGHDILGDLVRNRVKIWLV